MILVNAQPGHSDPLSLFPKTPGIKPLFKEQQDSFNAWFDKFMAEIKYDQVDMEEIKTTVKHVVELEAQFGERHIAPEDMRQAPFVAQVAYNHCVRLDLKLTAVAFGIMILGCNSPGDVVMNIAIAKKQLELIRKTPDQIADSKFMATLFGQGAIDPSFYSEMWDLQKVSYEGSDNLLDHLTPEHFQQNVEALV